MKRPRIEQNTPVRSTAALAEATESGKGIKGYAWMWGAPDRLNRIIPKSAVPDRAVTVPHLMYHDDEQAIGSAVLGPPDDIGLPYTATFAEPEAGTPLYHRIVDLRALIKAGGIPAVSISWLALEPPQYDGDPWDWDATITFPKIDLLELSVCPVPANPLVTLQAASLMGQMTAPEIADLLTLPTRSEATPRTPAALPAQQAQASADDAPAGSLVAICGQLDDAIDNLVVSLDREDDALTRSLASVADTLCDELLAVVGVVDDDEAGESAKLDPQEIAGLLQPYMLALESEAAALAI